MSRLEGGDISIRPTGQSFDVGFDDSSQITHVKSLKKANQFRALYQHLRNQIFSHPFIITNFEIDTRRQMFHITVKLPGENLKKILIPKQELSQDIHAVFERGSSQAFQDGFTLAATTYFQSRKNPESKIPTQWHYLTPQSRIVAQRKQVALTRYGLSRLQQVFCRFFQPKVYQEWVTQNRESVTSYQQFLIAECGREKMKRIEQSFGFSLEKMKEEGEPLLPIYIYYFNIGMNDIEMTDVEAFAKKMHKALNTPLDPQIFTRRELRGIGDLNTLERRFKGLKETADLRVVSPEVFSRCVDAVMTSEADWERVYTGRKFTRTLKGSTTRDIDDRSKIRPWVDLQEIAQTHFEMRHISKSDPRAEKIFSEYLSKFSVKKRLMRSTMSGKWRVGALIPSPFKDEQGNTIWYQVVQGVDSGKGKLWYTFKPAHPKHEADYATYRVLRDTSRQGNCQRAKPTISRDLAKEAGYKYNASTALEDQAFYERYTLPIWMGHLYIARSSQDPQERQEALQKALELTHLNDPSDLDSYGTLEDHKRLQALLLGKSPPPLTTAGASLGGFDAQYDVMKQTVLRGRIPITAFKIYTHSTLKIGEKDNALFKAFIQKHLPLIQRLGGSIAIDHMIEESDVVPMFGKKRTFLGEGLENLIPVHLRVFKVIPTSTHPQIVDLEPHIRRVEHLEVGKDIEWIPYTIAEYRVHSSKKKILGRSPDFWHTFGRRIGLYALSQIDWRLERLMRPEINRIKHKNRNDKLVVDLKGFQFIL